MFDLVLLLHIVAGVICLITGLLAAASKKKKGSHTTFGEIYHGSYIIVFLTSILMAILHWDESAYLFYIALFSYGLALIGYIAAKVRKRNWLALHIGGMLGSYIGVMTAVLVVNASKIPLLNEIPILLIWFLPTIIGTPIITFISNKYIPRKSQSL